MIPTHLHRIVTTGTSAREEACWGRFHDIHPTWVLRTWGPLFDPQEFELGSLFRRCRSSAQVADLVRIEVLWRHGGVCVDPSCDPVRELNPLLDNSCIIGTSDGNFLDSSVIGCEAAHPGLRACMDVLESEDRLSLAVSPDDATGRILLTSVLGGRDDVTVVPPELFLSWTSSRSRKAKPDPAPTPSTYLLHHRPPAPPGVLTQLGMRRAARQLLVTAHAGSHRLRRELRSLIQDVMELSPTPRGTFIGGDRVLVRLPNGLPLLAVASDRSLTPELTSKGIYDRNFWELIRRAVRPGDHVVDVGANVGLFTLAMADAVKRFGRVYAYEPDPEISSVLQDNLRSNWMTDRLVPLQMAAWSENGQITFRRHPNYLLLSAAGPTEPSGSDGGEGYSFSTVPCERLDSRIPRGVPVRLIKIDVEGGEHHVIEGMRGLLETGRVHLLDLEVIRDNAGEGWPALVRAMRGLVEQGALTYTINWRGGAEPISLDRVIARAGAFGHVLFSFVGHPTQHSVGSRRT